MVNGIETVRTEGTPQGSPLSPILSNIMLDDLDKELERRGHTFCRYADDCNIYVASMKAGTRVMASITQFLAERLNLRVNAAKSAVDRPWKLKYLGYSMTSGLKPRLKPAEKSVARLKANVKEAFRRGRGCSLAQNDRDNLADTARLVPVFQVVQREADLRETGWMDTAETPMPTLATMENPEASLSESYKTWH